MTYERSLLVRVFDCNKKSLKNDMKINKIQTKHKQLHKFVGYPATGVHADYFVKAEFATWHHWLIAQAWFLEHLNLSILKSNRFYQGDFAYDQ